MTVLSDDEIRKQIAAGKLVSAGRAELATECSYSFLPGKAFLPGSTDAPVDLAEGAGDPQVVVEPGRMIWVRTRDRVLIPNDMVGFWWQTNTLSRKGLMLVNMSMVEPGYEGDLACLFVNFGKQRVLIKRDTVVAKMVFVNISGRVLHPFTASTTRTDYDTALNELTLEQPESFLQVAELAGVLRDEREAAIADIRSVSSDLKKSADDDLRKAREQAVNEFKDDIPGVLKKTFAWALGLFAILTLASLVASYLKGELLPNVKEVARAEAEDTLRERTMIAGTPNSAETVVLLRKIDELNKRIDALDAQRKKR